LEGFLQEKEESAVAKQKIGKNGGLVILKQQKAIQKQIYFECRLRASDGKTPYSCIEGRFTAF